MFKPARMTRVLLGGHKDHLESTIDVLHKERLVHLEDFEDPTGTTSIGTPLERGDASSELLVRARGLLKAIDAEGLPGKETATDPAKALAEAEAALKPALDAVAEARNDVARLDAEVSQLAPLVGLEVELSATDLRSVKVFIGTVRDTPSLPLGVEASQHGNAIAVVAGNDQAEATEKALGAAGFNPAQIPADAEGTPAQAMATLVDAHKAALAHLDAQEAALAGARDAWAPRIAAVERALTVDVDKTQAPLKMAVTGATFHIEGWVPANKATRLQNAVSAKLGDSVYFESLGDGPVGSHDDHGDHDHHHGPEDEAPVKLENKGLAKPYEFMLGLLGRPRYWEIDPTKLMLIFFPLFFGLMVGDVLVGLAIMGMGMYLKKNHIFGIGGPAVGKALTMGGFMAVIVGAFIFGEALGMHFVVSDEALDHGEHSWEEIIYGSHIDESGHRVLNAEFPATGFFHKHVSHHGGHGTDGHGADNHSTDHGDAMNGTMVDAAHGAPGNFQLHAESTDEHGTTNILAPHGEVHLKAGPVQLGYYSKIHDIQALLAWCILIAVVHLNLAFLLGIRNVAVGHGVTLAIQEKLSWVTAQIGLGIAVWGGALGGPSWGLAVGIGVFVASIALLWKGVEKALGAPGFVAILEFLGFFGNILSYTRLAAIGASKAGMALAFAAIGFDVIGGGDVQSFAGWIVYGVGMILITALAMLSGGLQSLRLQFVEFFGKFYEGGGRAYTPFGRK